MCMTFVLMLMCLALTTTHLLHRVDRAFFELAAQAADGGAGKPLAVIVVDDRTIEHLGGWPFSRETRERMMDRLVGSGVAAIGIDLTSLRDASHARAADKATDKAAAETTGRDNGRTASAAPAAGTQGRRSACAGAASLQCDPPYELYSYINVLDGRVPSDSLSGRPVLIRASIDGAAAWPAASPDSGLPLASVDMAGSANEARLKTSVPREIDFAIELLFNEWVVCMACALLYRLTPRAGMVATFALTLAIAAGAFALFRFGDRILPPTTGMLICVLACVLWSWRRLEALLRFIVRLADRLTTEPSLHAEPAVVPHCMDPVWRELSRAGALDAQVRRYRALIDAWVDSLPEATLIASASGVVLLANERVAALCGELDGNPGARHSPAGRSVSDVLFQITASHRANEFAAQALTWLNHSPHGDDLSAQTKSQLDQGVEIANARGGLSLLIKCAPIRPSAFGERALVFHVADVSSVRLAERQRDMVLRFLSHDMRSPQASILALASQIKRDPSRYTPQRFAELISQYATRALNLSDDFLFLAKAESLPPKLAAVDPALVLGDAVDDLLPQASAKSTIVNLMAEPGLSTIADVQLLRRAFVNLIGNAIKFGREASTVDVELSATERHVKIAVTDYGAGISERDQEKLFREFTQLDGTSPLSGHGLGLAFVKTVVDSLGGKLQVRSRLGEGTTFLMFLSRHDHDAALGS
ncbi:histidine kinase-, DNA gyrase B-, and HSP90-like ATPase family protein [Burkholderia ambifaria AMMD]|nr:histidine kinase-, DNA gyrase B-, and HSP90-like ATPase family protein [Burkholderia ambifaria AMMD]